MGQVLIIMLHYYESEIKDLKACMHSLQKEEEKCQLEREKEEFEKEQEMLEKRKEEADQIKKEDDEKRKVGACPVRWNVSSFLYHVLVGLFL